MLKRLASSVWGMFNVVTHRLTLTAGDIAGAFVLLMALCITMDAVLRYGFNAPTVWVNEVSRYMLLVVIFMGLGYTLRENAHIRVDFVVNRLPRQVQNWGKVIHSTLFLAYTAMLFEFTWDLFATSVKLATTSYTALDVYLAPWQVFEPIGLAIISLLLICNIYHESKIALAKSKESHKESR